MYGELRLNDFFYDELYDCYVILINSQVVGEAETITQAKETFQEAMRVRREHIKRNPENESCS